MSTTAKMRIALNRTVGRVGHPLGVPALGCGWRARNSGSRSAWRVKLINRWLHRRFVRPSLSSAGGALEPPANLALMRRPSFSSPWYLVNYTGTDAPYDLHVPPTGH